MTARGTPERPQCRGTTAAGNPCRNRAAAGSMFCSAHGGGKRPVGRQEKITRDLVDVIVALVSDGAYYAQAAEAVGIHRDTLSTWRTRGEDDLEHGRDTLYAALTDELTRANAAAEHLMVQAVRRHALIDWRAAAWYLERKHAARWARRDKIDLTADVISRPRDVEPEGDDREAILAMLRTATAPPAGA